MVCQETTQKQIFRFKFKRTVYVTFFARLYNKPLVFNISLMYFTQIKLYVPNSQFVAVKTAAKYHIQGSWVNTCGEVSSQVVSERTNVLWKRRQREKSSQFKKGCVLDIELNTIWCTPACFPNCFNQPCTFQNDVFTMSLRASYWQLASKLLLLFKAMLAARF